MSRKRGETGRSLIGQAGSADAQPPPPAAPAAGLRDTMPPIVAFRPAVMRDIIARRRHEIAVGKAVYAGSPRDK